MRLDRASQPLTSLDEINTGWQTDRPRLYSNSSSLTPDEAEYGHVRQWEQLGSIG